MGSTTGRLSTSSPNLNELNGVRKKIMKPSKFNKDEKVQVIRGNYKGLEGVISGKDSTSDGWMYEIKVVRSVPEIGFADSVDFGEEYLELVTPDVREVGKIIKPELVRVGDKIRAVRVIEKNGIEESRGGVVAKISDNKPSAPTFFNEHGIFIGYAMAQFYYVLDEESTIHELTLAKPGTRFTLSKENCAPYYETFIKHADGWWIAEERIKGKDDLIKCTIRAEKNVTALYDRHNGRVTNVTIV
jgi:hypothetical protein